MSVEDVHAVVDTKTLKKRMIVHSLTPGGSWMWCGKRNWISHFCGKEIQNIVDKMDYLLSFQRVSKRVNIRTSNLSVRSFFCLLISTNRTNVIN
jgi:hypothetical protein